MNTPSAPTGSGRASTAVTPIIDISGATYISPTLIAASDTNGNALVLSQTGNRLVKLQATPAPSAPRYDGLLWRSPAGLESGWGVNLTHQGDTLFAAWFTYDLDGSGMWLVMTNGARVSDTKFTGLLYRTTGAAFSAVPYDPAQFKTTEVGTATFEFSVADNGTFSYSVNGIAQSKPITRQAFGALPNCTAVSTAVIQADPLVIIAAIVAVPLAQFGGVGEIPASPSATCLCQLSRIEQRCKLLSPCCHQRRFYQTMTMRFGTHLLCKSLIIGARDRNRTGTTC